MSFIYDTIIIGSGIAGLYTAYKLQKKYPKRKVLVLEKMKKQYIGGRTGNEEFYGVNVVTGAGIGRKDKDVLLMKLIKDLKIQYKEFIAENQFAPTVKNPVDIGKVMTFLKKKYKEEIKRRGIERLNITFKEFALPILGRDLYNDFLTSSAYTDYENEDVYETLYYYGMDDNENGWTGISLSWKTLVDKISKNMDIRTSQNVVNISKTVDGVQGIFVLSTEQGIQYQCSQIVVATTITSVRKLFPSYPIYNLIEGQTFLRMYGKFTKESALIMKQYAAKNTIVAGPIHRIIPMDVEKGVYMIAYTDNDGAKFFKDSLKNTKENREYWAREVERALGFGSAEKQESLKLVSILDFYWPIGTHYYKPLPNAGPYKNRAAFIKESQRPFQGIFVVGEMVSRHQGWVEGALESVEAVWSSL